MSTTQAIYKGMLQMPEFEPPEPKGKKSKYGQDAICWLCAGDTENLGWHLKDVIGSAFTDTNIAKAVQSQTMCYSCAALMKKEAWELACEKHGHSPYFPVKDDKKPFVANWMFSSHVFSGDDWLRPERKQIAEVLLNPPKPPFVITLAEVGKKHVIFRAKLNHSQDSYFIQLDDATILIKRTEFTTLLALVEAAYEHFSKDSILTGDYNQAAILKAGLGIWREYEAQFKEYRLKEYDMLRVACFVARKHEL